MSFRRINVDQYDEDHSIAANDLIPENPLSDDDLISKVQSTASQVRSLLQRGDTHAALAAVLSLQPYGTSPALTQAKVGNPLSLRGSVPLHQTATAVLFALRELFCITYVRQRMLLV